ncbi:MAG TPA: hypothetical protein VJ895_00625 [Candidatus Nanoarchaeia archaeon]|nr:hypothetical protein [Candidatus Nanoarchaeia archaeon]
MKKLLTVVLLMISLCALSQNNFDISLAGGFDISRGSCFRGNKEKSLSIGPEVGLKFQRKKMRLYQKSENFTNLYALFFYEISNIETKNKQRITSLGFKGEVQLIENQKNWFVSGLLFGLKAGYFDLKESSFFENLFLSSSGLVIGASFNFIFFEPVSLIFGFKYDEYFFKKENFEILSLNIGTRIYIK